MTRLSLGQAIIPFYPQSPAEELQANLTLINSGSRPLRATVVVPLGFVIDRTEVELEPEAEAQLPFSLRAPRLSNWQETITVQVAGGELVQATVVCAAPPTFAVAQQALSVLEGEQGPFTVVLRHTGGGPAYVTSVQARGGRIQAISEQALVQPGGDLPVRFTLAGGGAAGDSTETLEVALLNGGVISQSFLIKVLQPPRLELSDDRIQFGTVLPHRSRSKSLRLTNRGESPLEIRQVALVEGDGRWSLQLSRDLPRRLSKNEEVDVLLTVRDAGAGPTRARVLISSDDTQHPQWQVSAEAQFIAEPPVSDAYVGIDFGTTHSCICVLDPSSRQPRVLVLEEAADDPEEQVTMPSCVFWKEPPLPGNLRDCVVGRAALAYANNPAFAQATSVSVKRKLGQRQPERILGVGLMPHEIAARIIRRLVDTAEDYLGALVHKAVVTVPANFTPPQVRATVEACLLVGLDAKVVPKQMMDEPVGAAVDYLYDISNASDDRGDGSYTLVYDFGGGTLDISVIQDQRQAGVRRLNVVATKGDNAFGGDDLTEVLRGYLQAVAQEQTRGQIPADPPEKWEAIPSAEVRRMHVDNYVLLRSAAERLKRALSGSERRTDGCELWVASGLERRREYVGFELTRGKYEELISPRLQESRRLVDRALRAAGVRGDQIGLILLVGKSSRTPLVGRMLENHLGLRPVLHREPKACVARGACIKGELISSPQAGEITELLRELDRTNCRYGIIVLQRFRRRFQTLIGEGAAFPASGVYPGSGGAALNVLPGAKVTVALNRGELDDFDGNGEIASLGEVVVDDDGTDGHLPLEVIMTIENHRTIAVQLRVNGQETTAARFEEY